MAEKQLRSLERRLTNLPELRHYYTQFMKEYSALGHMSKVDANSQLSP